MLILPERLKANMNINMFFFFFSLIGIISFGVHILAKIVRSCQRTSAGGARSPHLVSRTGPKLVVMVDANMKRQMTDVRDL